MRAPFVHARDTREARSLGRDATAPGIAHNPACSIGAPTRAQDAPCVSGRGSRTRRRRPARRRFVAAARSRRNRRGCCSCSCRSHAARHRRPSAVRRLHRAAPGGERSLDRFRRPGSGAADGSPPGASAAPCSVRRRRRGRFCSRRRRCSRRWASSPPARDRDRPTRESPPRSGRGDRTVALLVTAVGRGARSAVAAGGHAGGAPRRLVVPGLQRPAPADRRRQPALRAASPRDRSRSGDRPPAGVRGAAARCSAPRRSDRRPDDPRSLHALVAASDRHAAGVCRSLRDGVLAASAEILRALVAGTSPAEAGTLPVRPDGDRPRRTVSTSRTASSRR